MKGRGIKMSLPLRAGLGCVLALASACSSGAGHAGMKPKPPDWLPQGSQLVTLNPADFSTTIDNPYWPMKPGTQRKYRELDGDGSIVTVTVTVTSETKLIANGIRARVVRDTVRRDDEIIEDTLDWYAQDTAGSIWYLGEDTAEFENGKITSTEGSFEAGVDGALPGIAMPAEPKVGQAYRQEYYKGEAEDNGEVLSISEMVDVKHGHFDRVVLTKDTITIDPEVLEYKFYAPGFGPVLTLDISGGVGREELVSVSQVPDGTATGPLGNPD